MAIWVIKSLFCIVLYIREVELKYFLLLAERSYLNSQIQEIYSVSKLSSGHRTGKGQFSFQSQRKAMPKNAQTTAQLHSSHMLVKQCSKFFKPGVSNTWTMNSLMFKLVLEKAEEPEIKLPTSTGSWKKEESFRKTSVSALLTMPKPLTAWITISCGKFW